MNDTKTVESLVCSIIENNKITSGKISFPEVFLKKRAKIV